MIPHRTYIVAGIGISAVAAAAAFTCWSPANTTVVSDRIDTDCVLKRAETPPEHAIAVSEIGDYYNGTFQWSDSAAVQRTALDVHSVESFETNGRPVIHVRGRGTYMHSRDANFDFTMVIHQETGVFRMVESNPDVAEGFITEGAHDGRMTFDGDEIHARWTDDFGGSGTLKLSAATMSGRPF